MNKVIELEEVLKTECIFQSVTLAKFITSFSEGPSLTQCSASVRAVGFLLVMA